MKLNKTLRHVALAGAISLALPVFAQSAPQSVMIKGSAPGHVMVADVTQAQGTITAIDKKKRTVVIKAVDGKEMPLVLGEEAKNIDQLAVGDIVTLTYAFAVELEVTAQKGDGIAKREDSESAKRSAPGEKPAGMVEQTTTFVADVIKKDAKAQTVTFKGAKHTVTLKVKDPEQFKLLKVGNQVSGVYKEAIALAVTPAAAK